MRRSITAFAATAADRSEEETLRRGRAHLSVVPHITTELVGRLCADLT